MIPLLSNAARRCRARFDFVLIAFFVAIFFCISAPAQVQRAIPATATLPESNEAAILSSGVREAIQSGDVRLAIRRIEQFMQLSGELVAEPDGRTYQPVWRHARRLFAALPPMGVETYRTMYDAEVAGRFREARDQVDMAALRDLFERYPLATSAPEIGRELAALLVDQGAYGEALEILREMEQSGTKPTYVDRALRIVAFAKIGALQSAQREIDAARVAADIGRGDDRLKAIVEWMNRARSNESATGEHAALSPILHAPQRWEEELPSNTAVAVTDDESLATAVAQKRRLPLLSPIIAGDQLLVRSRDVVWALDELTLAVRWRSANAVSHLLSRDSSPRPNFGLRVVARGGGMQLIDSDAATDADLSGDARDLLYSYIDNSISVGFRRVYTIEAGMVSVATLENISGFNELLTSRNVLVARDEQSGAVVWRLGSDPTGELYGAAFQDAPIVVGENLAVAILFQNELRVALLDPRDGHLVRMATVVGRPLYLPPEGGSCRLSGDQTTIYVSTGNGVVAAFNSETLHWKWASLYPSNVARRFGDVWGQGRDLKDFPAEKPLLSGDLLILAPPDSAEFIALDRFTGEERWRALRGDEQFLIGANESALFVAGNQIVALDESDGRTIRWRSVPLEISGRAALRNDRLFVPTRAGMVVLDASTGRVISDQWAPHGESREARSPASGNAVVSGNAVFCVSPNVAVRFADEQATEKVVNDLLAKGGSDGRAYLAQAWLHVMHREYGQALSAIQNISTDDTQAVARDRLLGQVFVALSHETADREERLKLLEQARSLARSPETVAQLAVLIGSVLEEGKQWDAALSHYRDLLLRDAVLCRASSDDPDWWISSDTLAAQRLIALLANPEIDAAQDFVVKVTASVGSLELAAMRKYIAVLPPGPQRMALKRALLQRRPAPELCLNLLDAADDPAAGETDRRAALLDRWEVHTALGLLEEAQVDAALWRDWVAVDSPTTSSSQPGESQEAQSESADDAARRVQRIERSMRKLETNREPPFMSQVRRRWVSNATLLLDPAHPLAFDRAWCLAHDTEQDLIVFYSTRNGERLRETPARLSSAAPSSDTPTGKPENRPFWPPQFEIDDVDWDPASVVAVYKHKAAAVIPGGIVCVGLGPERRGGQRLWERAIGEWSTLPADTASRLQTCPDGVVVNPRPGRVMLLRWDDGQIAWQRDLSGTSIRSCEVTRGRVLLLSDDGRISSMRCDTGAGFIRSVLEMGTVIDMAVVDDSVVIWTESAMHGIDPLTLGVLWSAPTTGLEHRHRVFGASLLAYQSATGKPWSVINPQNGQSVIPHDLAIDGEIEAWAADASHIYVASHEAGDATDFNIVRKRTISAYGISTGDAEWTHSFDGITETNVTQLIGNPSLIPILVSATNGNNMRETNLGFIEKNSGAATKPESISKDVGEIRTPGVRRITMLVSPSRVVVQYNGVLAAYGSSATENVP